MHSTDQQQLQRQGAAGVQQAVPPTRREHPASTAQLEALQWDAVASGALVLRGQHLSVAMLQLVADRVVELDPLEADDAAAELDHWLTERRVELRGELPGSALSRDRRRHRLVRLVEAVRRGRH